MPARLYVVPASHPCAAAARALELKGVPFKTINLVLVFHKLHQRVRFGGKGTVPGIVFEDGSKVLGSRAIIRELDRRQPEPQLVTGGDAAEEAEAWGDDVLQPLVRRVIWLALSRRTEAQLSFIEGLRLTPPVPPFMAKFSGGGIAWAERKLNAASDGAVREDLARLGEHLSRIEGWLDAGVLGGERVNAADLQIASGLRLLLTVGDLAPLVDGRPAGPYARRVFPDYPGHVPAGALPPEWLPAPLSVA